MKRAAVTVTVISLIASGTVAAVAGSTDAEWSGLRAGVGVVDATWHVGAGAGQYASDTVPNDLSDEWDPNVQHVKQASSYGVASRLSIRAIVLQDGKGDAPVALVKDDNYLAQDMLTRRVAQILAADGSAVTYDNMLLSATHDHNSPYYSTPAAGRLGCSRTSWTCGCSSTRPGRWPPRSSRPSRPCCRRGWAPPPCSSPTSRATSPARTSTEDGAPAGYPMQDNDHGLVVMRFDDMTDRPRRSRSRRTSTTRSTASRSTATT